MLKNQTLEPKDTPFIFVREILKYIKIFSLLAYRVKKIRANTHSNRYTVTI